MQDELLTNLIHRFVAMRQDEHTTYEAVHAVRTEIRKELVERGHWTHTPLAGDGWRAWVENEASPDEANALQKPVRLMVMEA
jgi:hypothetical protein